MRNKTTKKWFIIIFLSLSLSKTLQLNWSLNFSLNVQCLNVFCLLYISIKIMNIIPIFDIMFSVFSMLSCWQSDKPLTTARWWSRRDGRDWRDPGPGRQGQRRRTRDVAGCGGRFQTKRWIFYSEISHHLTSPSKRCWLRISRQFSTFAQGLHFYLPSDERVVRPCPPWEADLHIEDLVSVLRIGWLISISNREHRTPHKNTGT